MYAIVAPNTFIGWWLEDLPSPSQEGDLFVHDKVVHKNRSKNFPQYCIHCLLILKYFNILA